VLFTKDNAWYKEIAFSHNGRYMACIKETSIEVYDLHRTIMKELIQEIPFTLGTSVSRDYQVEYLSFSPQDTYLALSYKFCGDTQPTSKYSSILKVIEFST